VAGRKSFLRKPLRCLALLPGRTAFGVEGAVPLQYTARLAGCDARTAVARGVSPRFGV